MEDLKILQRQFEQAAMQFVGLYHKFLWRGKKKDCSLIPYELTTKYELELRALKTKPKRGWMLDWDPLSSLTPALAFDTTENKKDSQYVPDVPKPTCLRQCPYYLSEYNENDPEEQYSHAHFLLKPANATWDSNRALSSLDLLLRKLVPYINPTELGLNNDPLYNYVNDFDSWHPGVYDADLLLILHILMKSEPLRINKDSIVNECLKAQKNEPYVRTIDDVFSSSALVCEMLLEQPCTAEMDLLNSQNTNKLKSNVEDISAIVDKSKKLSKIRMEFLKAIAKQIEDLLVKYPWAKELFNSNANTFKALFDEWKLASDNKPRSYSDPSGNNGKDGYEYDKDEQEWSPIQTPKLPPDPALWEIDDKLCCHYVTLGVIRDMIYADKTKPIVKDILQGTEAKTDAFSPINYFIENDNANKEIYSDDSIELALSQVEQDLAEKPAETEQEIKHVKERKQKNRPTKAQMKTRNSAVLVAAIKLEETYGRLPSVDEIVSETSYTADQIYATAPYKEGKIAKRTARLTPESTGSSVAASEQFGEKSIEHSRANRLSKSEQLERDKLIDESKADDARDEKQHKRYLRNKKRIDAEEY